jgi:hypothetical protein
VCSLNKDTLEWSARKHYFSNMSECQANRRMQMGSQQRELKRFGWGTSEAVHAFHVLLSF